MTSVKMSVYQSQQSTSKKRYPIQMATTLEDINQGCTILLNLFSIAGSINQDAVLAQAEPIEGVPRTLVDREDAKKAGNSRSI